MGKKNLKTSKANSAVGLRGRRVEANKIKLKINSQVA
jgi:hypothetical protein